MRKIQSQGVHHITLVGADRQTSIDFWEGMLGMPLVFEQPNLDNPNESHLYFDPGDGRLITIFTNEERTPDPARTPTDPGAVHHVALSLSHAPASPRGRGARRVAPPAPPAPPRRAASAPTRAATRSAGAGRPTLGRAPRGRHSPPGRWPTRRRRRPACGTGRSARSARNS